MTATKTQAIERLLAESKRLFPGHSHDGCPHVLFVEGRLLWADTVGEAELDPAGAAELAEEFATLDPEAGDTYDRAHEIVMAGGFTVPGTETW